MNWIFKTGFMQGALWANLMSIVGVINDALMCHLGSRLPVTQVTFFRFLLSTILLLPFLSFKHNRLHLQNIPLHALRVLLGAAAIGLCCYSVTCMSLSQNTAIMFTEPLFFLPLAALFLNEKVHAIRWIATGIGFCGLVYLLNPTADVFSITAIVPVVSAILFALLDIVTKKIVHHESTLSMLLTFGAGCTLISLPFTLFTWVTPTMHELLLLLMLGVGANMIQVCLFYAFRAADASALAPFRYTELIFSALFGFLLFQQVPTQRVLIGSGVIILSTLYLILMERNHKG